MNDKEQIGRYAAALVEDHMIVGLGSGTTAAQFIQALTERIKNEHLSLTLVATSEDAKKLAESAGAKVTSLNELDRPIDLTIDGVDEFTSTKAGIKGGGGCLMEEKIVAMNSKHVIWIAEAKKHVKTLGRFPLPIEVLKSGSAQLKERLAAYHPTWRLTPSGERFLTDNGNYILDLHLDHIDDPKKLHKKLIDTVGVVETGLFLDIADEIVTVENGHMQSLIEEDK